MPAHIVYPKVDNKNTAGTSKIWLEDILRHDLNFKGVIISDCLSMKGSGGGNPIDKVLQTLKYNDLALFSNLNPQEYMDLLKEMEKHNVSMSQEAQQRIENWLAPTSTKDVEIFDNIASLWE